MTGCGLKHLARGVARFVAILPPHWSPIPGPVRSGQLPPSRPASIVLVAANSREPKVACRGQWRR